MTLLSDFTCHFKTVHSINILCNFLSLTEHCCVTLYVTCRQPKLNKTKEGLHPFMIDVPIFLDFLFIIPCFKKCAKDLLADLKQTLGLSCSVTTTDWLSVHGCAALTCGSDSFSEGQSVFQTGPK